MSCTILWHLISAMRLYKVTVVDISEVHYLTDREGKKKIDTNLSCK